MRLSRFVRNVIYIMAVLLLSYIGVLVCIQKANQQEPVIYVKDTTGEFLPGMKIMIAKSPKEEEPVEEAPVCERPWEEPVVPIAAFSGELPRIICWGDSLTQSVDCKSAYPDVLEQLSQTTVINYGIMSETTTSIAMREGAVRVYAGECLIPEQCIPIELSVTSKSGKNVQLLKYGQAGVNPCSIAGVTGNLVYIPETDTYQFTRSKPGEAVLVSEKTRITTSAMYHKKQGDVLVIFTGTNDGLTPEKVEALVKTQRAMLDYADCERYIIIGMTCKKVMPEIERINELLSEEYGEHFLDIRTYMLQYGLGEAQITPTKEDEQDIRSGEIPGSLRKDYVHGNEHFYRILANQVYRKLQYLGYLPVEEPDDEERK